VRSNGIYARADPELAETVFTSLNVQLQRVQNDISQLRARAFEMQYKQNPGVGLHIFIIDRVDHVI
ncbi:MAG: hypothetical protein WB759_04100, partial [Methanoregula sp.]